MDVQDPTLCLRAWRNRQTGTMHLSGDCPDFERLPAILIEDVVWWSHQRYRALCPWCFPAMGDVLPG